MWLSTDAGKRRMEQFVLVYSPVWMVVIAVVQFSGWLASWGELAHLALGVGLCLPLWLYGNRFEEGARFNLLILIHSTVQCYFGSMLFFDAFGMEYHFNTRLTLNRTPVFLYLLTVCYFSTYYVALVVAWRRFRARRPKPSPVLETVARALFSYAVAFAETAAMANESLRQYFSYRDPRFVMIYGSIAYGTIFFITLPLFHDIDEPGARALPTREAVWRLLALNMLCLIAYEVYRAALL